MNFFNDIGKAFQSAGQTINNEVIKPTEATLNPKNTGLINALDPNKNGFTNAFSNLDPKKNGLKVALDNLENHMQKLDPNKNGASNAFNPHKNGFVNALDPKKIETQINKELNKISPTLNLPKPPPPPKSPQDIMKEIEKHIIKPIDIKIIKPFEKDVIKPFEKDVIKGFEKDIIKGFEKDIIKGFEKDIINPSKTIFDNIGDVFDSMVEGGEQQTKTNTNSSDNTITYVLIGATVLIGMYFFIPNKVKEVNNKI